MMNNIFKILDQYIYTIRKKYFIKKYGKGVQTINLIENDIILTIGENHSYTICINEVIDIIYNIDENGYYFRVRDRDNDRFSFDRKYDTRYRANRDFISKIKNSNISLTPDFGQYGGIYEWQEEGIIRHCLLSKKFLLTITVEKDNNYMFYLNYGNFSRFNYRITSFENLNISKELKNNTININKKMHNSSSGFYILDKSLTFNRGYCITSVDLMGCNNSPQVFGDDIFYSFDEEEIKTKIIELFEKKGV